MRVLVGGGSGLVGRHLVKKLASQHIESVVITRNPRKKDISWETLAKVGIPENIDTVVNLAGRNIGELSFETFSSSGYKSFLTDLRSSRIETTRLLSKLAIESRIKRFVNASAIGFYKDSYENIYEENADYVNDGFLTELVKDWEDSVNVGPNCRGFIMRMSLVLAKECSTLHNMYWQHKLGFGGPISSGKQWISWIHMEDALNLFYNSIIGLYDENTSPGAKCIINLSSPNCVTQSDFSKALSRSLHAPVSGLFPTPGFIFPILMGKERAQLILGSYRVYPGFAVKSDFKFKYPRLVEAFKEIYG